MIEFIKGNPARLYAIAATILALVAHYVRDLPDVLILAVVAATLGIGESVQRLEDTKTREAGADVPTGTVSGP
ncbi:hypothetical protein OG196_15215 [Kitasatospora purpeofusca]|uniref:hypothetical protein n=1 Tax=Kitasatospora purpeofusca TaxID=67352 RepID=UPI002E123FDD|nr:hypothetical protein OG196_15215 [Kitasatospora purpeofusca]